MAEQINITPREEQGSKESVRPSTDSGCKGGIDTVSDWFDKAFDEVGQAYGRQAVRRPVACACAGFWVLLLTAIPVLVSLTQTDHNGRPMRSPVNKNRGFAYRSDYKMWSPVSTPQAERLDRVEKSAQKMRKEYLDSAAHKAAVIGFTKNPDIASDLNQECKDQEKGKEEQFLFLLYRKNNGVDLCKTDNVDKIWNWEQYVKKRVTKEGKGYAYGPDFCPLNPDMNIGPRMMARNATGWNGAASNILYQTQGFMEPCDNYKTAGHPGYHEHKACVLKGQSPTIKCECEDRSACTTTNSTYWGATRPDVRVCKTTADSTCIDDRGGYSASACVRCAEKDSNTPGLTAKKGDSSTPGTCLEDMRVGFNRDQMPQAFWCSNLAFLSPVGLMNAVAYNFDASVDDPTHWAVMLRPSPDPQDPAAAETRANKYGPVISDSHYGASTLGLLREFSFRPVMAGFMTDVVLSGTHRDRRQELVRNGTCDQCRAELETAYVADLDRFNGSYVAPADSCSDCHKGGDDACYGCVAGGAGGPLPPGADPNLENTNRDPALPGNQNVAECMGYTTENDCWTNGCQWYTSTFLAAFTNAGGLDPAHWTPAGAATGICRPCVDDSRTIFRHPVVTLAGCAVQDTACACGVNSGGCAIAMAWDVASRACPHVCPQHIGSAVSMNNKNCASSGVNPDLPPRSRTMLRRLKDAQEQQSTTKTSSAETSTSARKLSVAPAVAEGTATQEQCQACREYVTQGLPASRDSLDGDGSKVRDTMAASYEAENCKGFLVAIRMRAECELNHPDWRRISNNWTPPQLKDRDDWVREMISEYNENYKKDPETGEKLDAPPAGKTYAGEPSRWRQLEDAGIGVTMYHPYFLGQETTELVVAELASLSLTFVLMYFFLIAAIGPKQWRRWVLSSLVLVQPFLAILLAMGMSAIPWWWWVPGDLDRDGEEDMVVPTTVLTALGLHLMLAVVVDYDIILVRAFDRITKMLPFEDRVAVAAGYAHRTVSVSMLVGVAAFALGSFVDLPVLTYFCWQSFVAMIGLYVGMFSMFLATMVMLEKQDPANAQEENVKNLTAKSTMKKLVVKNSADMKFANALSKPVIVAGICVVELAFICLYLFGEPLKAEFEGSRYLLPDSKVRVFTLKVDEMGGLPDPVSVWLPPSHIGQYHKKENRQYYMQVIDQMRAIPEVKAIDAGLPSLWSWLHEYEAQLRGVQGFQGFEKAQDPGYNAYSANYDTTAGEYRPAHAYASTYAHKGCVACPRMIRSAYYDTALRLPDTMTDAQIDLIFAAPAALTKEHNGPFVQFLVKDVDYSVPGLEFYSGGQGAAITVNSAASLADAFQGTLASDGFHIASVTKVAPSSSTCGEVLRSLNPKHADERFANDTSVASFKWWLKSEVNKLSTGGKLEIRFKSIFGGRFATDDTFLSDKVACSNRTDYVGVREDFWGTPEGEPYFYDFVHDFYENWDQYKTCCATQYRPNTLLDKRAGKENKPHTAVFPKVESAAGRIHWATYGQKVAGLRSSIVTFFMKYDLNDSKHRIKVMHLLQDHLEKHRSMYPHRWGSLSKDSGGDPDGKADDSFVVARFFPNADRDENMNDYLQHHLLFVYIATIISCVVFMHPFYGTLTAVFLMLTMMQIQGLMSAFGMNLDIVTFAVLVMAMGFAIEYVVHIAHAFLHCQGRGLERTKNAQEEMGLTVFSAFLSTAVQQIVLLFMNSSLVFETYSGTMMLVIIKSGMTGFLLVPSLLGLLDMGMEKFFPQMEGGMAQSRRRSLESVDALTPKNLEELQKVAEAA
ncbi:unnamed protein product [Amoebophrya sp. A120]|nr:unnamed protein product [Amoebophrya sp. A120]|eukprot:GSA120T00025734001.1